MTTAITSPSGGTLHHRASRRTTPHGDAEAKQVRIKREKEQRLEENKEYLKNANIQAFLKAIAEAEGGGYDFKYGAIKGKKNEPWRFTDYSTHPGPGRDGVTTASGMYQINGHMARSRWASYGPYGLHAGNARSHRSFDA